jgi:hypothetical protein
MGKSMIECALRGCAYFTHDALQMSKFCRCSVQPWVNSDTMAMSKSGGACKIGQPFGSLQCEWHGNFTR